MISRQKIHGWLLFAVGGGLNTSLTYVIYLIANVFLGYQASYLLAYLVGIFLSYWFNAKFVFKVPLSIKGLSSYPVVYVVQYVFSAFILGGFVEYFNVRREVAPLVVACVMIPLTYFMSRFVLRWGASRS